MGKIVLNPKPRRIININDVIKKEQREDTIFVGITEVITFIAMLAVPITIIVIGFFK